MHATTAVATVEYQQAGNSLPQQFVPKQADSDAQCVALWLHSKAARTQTEYRREIARFLAFTGAPLAWTTLQHVQDYADSLAGKSDSTRARAVATVKSLLAFSQRIGHTAFNVGACVPLPKIKETLGERILSQEEVQRLIISATGRDKVLLRFLFCTGARCSEAVNLRWRDLSMDSEGRYICTLLGKGHKTRHVVLTAGVTKEVQTLRRPEDGPDAPLFVSRLGRPLSQSQVWRIVKREAIKAGIDRSPSPHWLRHAHATTALDRGCPLHVLTDSLGHSSMQVTSRYCHVRPGVSSSGFLGLD